MAGQHSPIGTLKTPSLLLNKSGLVTVTLTAFSAPMYLLAKPISVIPTRVVSPSFDAGNRSQLSFSLADSAGVPNDKTSTCRVWGLRRAGDTEGGGPGAGTNAVKVDEWKMVPLLDLALTCGANVIPTASKNLPSTLPTVINCVDTIAVIADYTRGAGAAGYHAVADNEAAIDFDREGCEHLVIEGVPASGCALHVWHVEL